MSYYYRTGRQTQSFIQKVRWIPILLQSFIQKVRWIPILLCCADCKLELVFEKDHYCMHNRSQDTIWSRGLESP